MPLRLANKYASAAARMADLVLIPLQPSLIDLKTRERVSYQDAYASGLGVCEAEPAGKAALEIREVYKYVSQLLDLPTTRNTHEENSRTRKRVA